MSPTLLTRTRVFERVRWRQTLAKAPQLAGHLQRLSTASQQLGHQLDAAVQNWIDKQVSFVARLSASCPYSVFAELPPEHRAAILAGLLKICGHYEFAPTPAAVDAGWLPVWICWPAKHIICLTARIAFRPLTIAIRQGGLR